MNMVDLLDYTSRLVQVYAIVDSKGFFFFDKIMGSKGVSNNFDLYRPQTLSKV